MQYRFTQTILHSHYEQAEKVVKLSLTIVTSLGTVMLPRIAYAYAHKDYKTIKANMMRSYRFVWFLTMPMFFGFIAISNNFVPWFFGPGYDKVVPLMQILSGLVIAIGLSNVTGIQYMLPTNQQNKLTLTVVCGAIVNFALNLFLIPMLQSIGAAIASLIAEITVTAVQFYMIRDVFSIFQIFYLASRYFVSGIIMLIIIWLIGHTVSPTIIHTFIIIGIGGILYFGLLFLFKDDMLLIAIDKIQKKMR